MKRKIVLGLIYLVALVALYIASGEISDILKAWYADNYMPRTTESVSSEMPDQVCLTFGADPKTTVAAQWRTATSIKDGAVQYREAGSPGTQAEVGATYTLLADKMITNDPENHRFSATMATLKPATRYEYRVGSKEKDHWSAWTEFTTAPAEPGGFSFGYMGDPQLGLDYWGQLVRASYERHPNAAFYVIAGDLVNAGKYRNEWDSLFKAGAGVFDRRPLVPVLGNHDYSSLPSPENYLKLFTLPENGPKDFPKEHDYAFTYGNALFVILDANQDPGRQAAWLEEQLKGSSATWKFVSYHQPAYSSAKNRDNPEVREVWGALFDKYHVDIALQGHDHAYLRTPPMRGGKRVESYTDGTVYVVSVSGTKYYDMAPRDYALVAFAKVSTYQIIDIETGAKNKLTYRAFDLKGDVKDEFVIEK